MARTTRARKKNDGDRSGLLDTGKKNLQPLGTQGLQLLLEKNDEATTPSLTSPDGDAAGSGRLRGQRGGNGGSRGDRKGEEGEVGRRKNQSHSIPKLSLRRRGGEWVGDYSKTMLPLMWGYNIVSSLASGFLQCFFFKEKPLKEFSC